VRILTDFDGVLTDEDAEAAAVGARLLEIVEEALGESARARELISDLCASIAREPSRYGWVSGGALACYADEDPYVRAIAVAGALFSEGPPDVIERLQKAGLESAEHLAARAFFEGTARFAAENPSHVLPEAVSALATLAAAGAEVAIVSNSPSERIEGLLREAGFLRFGQSRPRIVGGAMKFLLGEEPRALPIEASFGGRPIRLRRPHYARIIEEEQPDVVIGDVLSLDLALPAALRERAEWFSDARLFLRRHPETPAWALAGCREKKIEVVDSIARIPEVLGF
jgi:phosphoglycolate phosphatase-like HAD superfamily hydrolase